MSMGDKLQYQQSDFSGGLNRELDSTKIAPNEYYLLINGRHRRSNIIPIKEPLNISDNLPSGNYQGIYGFGNYGLVLVDGIAYFKDFNQPSTDFHTIVDWTPLDSQVSTIYAQAVPAATVLSSRKLINNSSLNGGVNLSSGVGGSPVCLLVQDSINQPNII